MLHKKLLILFFLLLCSVKAFAELRESVENKYYVISPNTAYDIKPQLMRNSPIREGGGSFNGHTDWYIQWRHQSTQTPYGCQLNRHLTTVRVIHTLPALSEYVTDKETIEVFNKFNEALTKHEKNHGENGLAAAREIEQAFSKIQPQQNCRQLSQMLNDIGKSIVQKYTQKDRDYDHTTRSGETEGAVIY